MQVTIFKYHNLFWFQGMAGFNPYENRPNVTKWMERVQSHLSPFYDEANEILELHVAKYNKAHGKPKSNI